jgi:hypothetical protein
MIYSIRQLKGRRRVSKVPEIKRTARIRQFRGGVYPRLILDFPSAIARPARFLAYASEQAPQSPEIATPRQVGARNDKRGRLCEALFSLCLCEARFIGPKQSRWGRGLPYSTRNDSPLCLCEAGPERSERTSRSNLGGAGDCHIALAKAKEPMTRDFWD